MKKLIFLLIVGGIAWTGYTKFQTESLAKANEQQESQVGRKFLPERNESTKSIANSSNFRCDGRVYCSQMTSCEEATYFLQNCPGVKMDGGNGGRPDGVPCESQWCKYN